MTTLSDVAKEANVSKMTVSRVINHPEQVTPELRAMVEKAMEKLNYHPNSIAQALVNNRTNVVKFVTLEDIDTTEPYYMNLLFGFARGLNTKQYAMQLVTDPNQIEKEHADGYLITGARNKDYELLDKLDKPFVLFGENHRGYDFVDSDNQLAEKMATQYALDRLYKHIIFIGIDLKEPFEYSREAGYINTLQQHQLIPQIFRVSNHSHAAQDVIHEHFKEFKKDYPNVIIELHQGYYREIEQWVEKDVVDFGITNIDGIKKYQTRKLFDDPLFVVVPKHHPWAMEKKIPLEKLQEEVFVVLDEGDEKDYLNRLEKMDISLNIHYRLCDDNSILSMVENGLGIAILPQLAILAGRHDLAQVRLEPSMKRSIGVILKQKKQLLPITEIFLRYMEKSTLTIETQQKSQTP